MEAKWPTALHSHSPVSARITVAPRSMALQGTTEALPHLRERAYVTAPTPHVHIYRERLRGELSREWRRCRKHSSRLQRTARLFNKWTKNNARMMGRTWMLRISGGISQADDKRYGSAAKCARRFSSVIMSSQTTPCCKLGCACYYRSSDFKVWFFSKKMKIGILFCTCLNMQPLRRTHQNCVALDEKVNMRLRFLKPIPFDFRITFFSRLNVFRSNNLDL